MFFLLRKKQVLGAGHQALGPNLSSAKADQKPPDARRPQAKE